MALTNDRWRFLFLSIGDCSEHGQAALRDGSGVSHPAVEGTLLGRDARRGRRGRGRYRRHEGDRSCIPPSFSVRASLPCWLLSTVVPACNVVCLFCTCTDCSCRCRKEGRTYRRMFSMSHHVIPCSRVYMMRWILFVMRCVRGWVEVRCWE